MDHLKTKNKFKNFINPTIISKEAKNQIKKNFIFCDSFLRISGIALGVPLIISSCCSEAPSSGTGRRRPIKTL
jgi:hypothetical protein